MKKVTISDIAKRAGVTKGTVSMVLNNYKDIPQSTRDAIFKIIKELDYYPFESARNLSKGTTDIIAFMTARFAAPFVSDILSAFERRAIQADKYINDITLYSTHNDRKTKEMLFKSILYGRKASALVALSINPDPKIILEYKRSGIPVVLIENTVKGAHSVNVDNFKGAYMAAEHLIATGRKNIGFISGWINKIDPESIHSSAVDRKSGFETALRKHGYAIKAANTQMSSQYTSEEGRNFLDNFIKKRIKLDAVFCAAGDVVAMGLMERARELGIKIPSDLAVIGFDDMMYARHLNPPLTTVCQPFDRIGAAAFDTAVDAIEGKLKKDSHIVIDPQLIIRKTT